MDSRCNALSWGPSWANFAQHRQHIGEILAKIGRSQLTSGLVRLNSPEAGRCRPTTGSNQFRVGRPRPNLFESGPTVVESGEHSGELGAKLADTEPKLGSNVRAMISPKACQTWLQSKAKVGRVRSTLVAAGPSSVEVGPDSVEFAQR